MKVNCKGKLNIFASEPDFRVVTLEAALTRGPVRSNVMKESSYLSRGVLGILGFSLLLAGAALAKDHPRNVSNPNNGMGTVVGRLSGTFSSNQVIYGSGESVILTPVSTNGGARAVTTRTDAEGRFVFQNLPAGEYELRTQLSWTTTYVEVNDDGSTDRMYADHSKSVTARVQAKPNQTVHINTWTEGAVRDSFYAYGGTLSKPHHPLVTCP
jgi:hypothetical protein